MTGPRYLWNLSLNHSNLYDAQLNLELNLFEGRGFYKKIFSKGIDLTYGLRYFDDRIQHKFKILLLEQQGIYPFTILSNNKIEDTIRKEYLFGQFGIKIFECNKLDYISSDISFLRVNTDLIFEPRKYTEHHLYGLPLEPGDFNIYLITNGFLGLANLKFEYNILDLSKSELKK
jgi:hypothetical protein